MKIAITGGKGGTGKSTIATALSLELAKKFKVALIDVDVECPDDHIILSIERNKIKDVKTLIPSFNQANCIKCGKCFQICRQNAIFFVKGRYPLLITKQCNGCGACIKACPENSIKKDSQVIGIISEGKIEYNSNTYFESLNLKNGSSKTLNKKSIQNIKDTIQKNFTLISGEVEVGCEATSMVVNATREYAQKLYSEYDFLIIDTPAGTHCNVIAALIDIDMALAVTEPTPLGAHDLELILQLLEKIAENQLAVYRAEKELATSPNKIIINQSDIGDENLIYQVAHQHQVEIIEEIPYDKSIYEKYSKGIPIFNQKIANIANFVGSYND